MFHPTKLYNTKFLSYIVSTSNEGPAFLSALLKSTFLSLQMTKYIAFYLPDNYPLFAPLSLPKQTSHDAKRPVAAAEGGFQPESHEPPKPSHHRPLPKKGKFKKFSERKSQKDQDDFYFKLVPKVSEFKGYSMYLCSRKDVLPHFKVRKARVEDTDDLVPMLRKQKV